MFIFFQILFKIIPVLFAGSSIILLVSLQFNDMQS